MHSWRLSAVLVGALASSVFGLRTPAFQASVSSRPSVAAPMRAQVCVMMSSAQKEQNVGSSLLRTLKKDPLQAPYHALSLVLLQKQKIYQEGTFVHTLTARLAQTPFHALSLILLQKAAIVATLKVGIDNVIKAAFHLYSIALLQLQRLPHPKPFESALHAYSLTLLRLQAAKQDSARLNDSLHRGVARARGNLEKATATLMRDAKNEKMA